MKQSLTMMKAGIKTLIRRTFGGKQYNLQGKIALITGASSGIGAATARAFADEGARVVLVARRENLLQAIADELPSALAISADLRQDQEQIRVVNTIIEQYGRIDVLVNNAGVARGGVTTEIAYDDLRQMVDVNLYALIRLTQLVLPGMIQRHSGQIINISSAAGEVRAPGQAVYSATKAAVNGFSDALRRELVGTGINVITILPGWVRTPMTAGSTTDDLRQARLYTPLFTVDEPQAVAQKIIHAIKHNKRQVTMGGLGVQLGIPYSRIFPRLMDLNYRVYFDTKKIIQIMKQTLQ
ncbi:MAG: oxidoreductase [Phototrophicales bacterium]|nr:MAG: oxidoreductase [Phototrophicales bacterium]